MAAYRRVYGVIHFTSRRLDQPWAQRLVTNMEELYLYLYPFLNLIYHLCTVTNL